MTVLDPTTRGALAEAITARTSFGITGRAHPTRPARFRLRVRFVDDVERRRLADLIGFRSHVDKPFRDSPETTVLEATGNRALALVEEVSDLIDDDARDRVTSVLDSIDDLHAQHRARNENDDA